MPNFQYEQLRGELDAGQLMQKAREKSGLADFGDDTFVGPFGRMLDCYARDANFNAAGLKAFKEEIVRDLVNRLRFQNDLKRHPEILDEDVSDPIVILGLPRSGTTKTQRMLGTDPNLLKTYTWQLMNPAPFPHAAAGQPDPRIAAAGLGDELAEGHLEVQAAHHMAVDVVEEDWILFEYTFNDWFQFNRTPSPSWNDWTMSRVEPSDLGNYQYVRSLFQYLQWQQGGRRNRRWLMKHCGHIAFLDELLEVFPKATLMHIHRHPANCMPSWAKFLHAVWCLRLDDVTPEFAGESLLAWAKIAMDRYLDARDRLRLDNRILDVPYDRIRDDPMPAFREIYRRAGHVLSAESEQGMLQWQRENEQGKHGKHSYSLELLGLSEKKIEDAFGEYIRRFINH